MTSNDTTKTMTDEQLLNAIYEAGVNYGKWRARYQERKQQFGAHHFYAVNTYIQALNASNKRDRLIKIANKRGLA